MGCLSFFPLPRPRITTRALPLPRPRKAPRAFPLPSANVAMGVSGGECTGASLTSITSGLTLRGRGPLVGCLPFFPLPRPRKTPRALPLPRPRKTPRALPLPRPRRILSVERGASSAGFSASSGLPKALSSVSITAAGGGNCICIAPLSALPTTTLRGGERVVRPPIPPLPRPRLAFPTVIHGVSAGFSASELTTALADGSTAGSRGDCAGF